MSKTNETNIKGGVTIINPRTALYGNIEGAITDIIKAELTEPQKPIRLSEIKIKGLKQAIKSIKIADADTTDIQKALVDNIDKVKAFIENHGNYFLTQTKTYQKPQQEPIKDKGIVWANEADYKGLLKYFEKTTKTHTFTEDEIAEQKAKYDLLKPKDKSEDNLADYTTPRPFKSNKVGDTYTFTVYQITDYEGLINDIKATVPQLNSYGIKDPSETEDLGELNPVYLEVSKLAQEVGIKPSGMIWARRLVDRNTNAMRVIYRAEYTEPSKDPNTITTDVRFSDRLVYVILLWTMVRIKDANEKALKDKREIVNIKNAKKHDVLMQPHAIGLTDMIDGAFEGREFKNLYETYRKEGYGSNEQIKKEGGWLVHLSGQQSELPFDFGEGDQKTLIKFMTNTKALVIDVTTALGRYLRDNPDHDPNDYISLTALAKYIGRYNDSKLKKGELRPQYRQQILNGLTMAQLISADYVVGKDKRGNKEWRKVYLLDRITDYKTYGNTNIVTGVKVDFTKEYKESVGLNLGVILDGVLLLNTPEHKALGAYILERFAQRQEATTKGEPQKMTADTLIKKAGITDSHKTNKLITLQKALDAFVENGLIEKWVCKNGTKAIRGCDKDSQTILVYPTKNLIESYAPKSQTQAEYKAIKLEQRNRLSVLKAWFKGYTSRETASQHLGISVAELNELLAGSKIISDDVLEKINEEL